MLAPDSGGSSTTTTSKKPKTSTPAPTSYADDKRTETSSGGLTSTIKIAEALATLAPQQVAIATGQPRQLPPPTASYGDDVRLPLTENAPEVELLKMLQQPMTTDIEPAEDPLTQKQLFSTDKIAQALELLAPKQVSVARGEPRKDLGPKQVSFGDDHRSERSTPKQSEVDAALYGPSIRGADVLAPYLNPATTEPGEKTRSDVLAAIAELAAAQKAAAAGTSSDREHPPSPVRGVYGNPYIMAEILTGKKQVDPKDAERVDAAEAALRDALREQRVQAINMDRPSPTKSIRERKKHMTQMDFDNLTPLQQAAVQFNALMISAVRKDLQHQNEYTNIDPVKREAYDKAVTDMFGEDRDSEKYAPQTVALLQQLGFTDQNSDLDDFLDLRSTVRRRDLEDLGDKPVAGPKGITTTVEDDRDQLMQSLAQLTQAYEKRLIKDAIEESGGVVRGFRNQARVARGEQASTSFGGGETKANATKSGMPAEQYFDGIYKKFLEDVEDHGGTPEEFAEGIKKDLTAGQFTYFKDYLNERLTREKAAEQSGGVGSRNMSQFKFADAVAAALAKRS